MGSWIHHRKFLMDPHLSINLGGSSGQTVSKLITISCPVCQFWVYLTQWCEVDMSSMSHWSKMIQIYRLYSNPNGYIVDRCSMPSNMSYGKEPKWSKSFSGWQLRCPLLPHRDSYCNWMMITVDNYDLSSITRINSHYNNRESTVISNNDSMNNYTYIWENYNISLTWILRRFGDHFPY